MPGRLEKFVNNRIYHIFNKTINKRLIFDSDNYCSKFLDIARYYQSSQALVSYSNIKNYDLDFQKKLFRRIVIKKYFNVEIFTFSLMPTHYHFLIRQKKDNGIPIFIADTLNSFTRYFNIKNEGLGPIFLPRFKSKRITTDEQAKHVSRYIHLNPLTAGIVNSIDELIEYRWSSLPEYLTGKKGICNTKFILNLFDDNKQRYRKFLEDNINYQKTLDMIKHAKNF
ncbi:hypothetical protein A2774_05335 [Candidatus Roizmanbacteria bacterium RIFCSPHIGHO2_01_FULL_39_12c]|uniref:Transposase IS200-like domain-containing protein n=1 Tax=Candidatus Roizmanbacteria bacterium RIFCSPHIGHO2_01_FULL_39_12c TaxID=1802031 RepID=A0A1F7GD45_9BACT|nr:MAG: hypothetical protein A2774_05335 [Candidatus Roizmanbacteria bacterium RIFCSPHIGHO2_01_FULL_39_12c]